MKHAPSERLSIVQLRRKALFVVVAVALMVSGVWQPAGWISSYAAEPEPSPTPNTRTVEQFNAYRVIDDFETEQSMAHWQAGENMASVSRVTTEANVFNAAEGSYFLNAASELNLQNNVWRTIFRNFDEPLDLSDSRYLMLAFAHYGYLPNDMPYLVKIRAYSGDDSVEGIARTYENKWNRIGLVIGDWAGRNAIDRIEISWQHRYDRTRDEFPGGDPLPYWPDPKIQIDYVHASNDLGWRFNYDGDAEGWTGSATAVYASTENGVLSFEVIGANPSMTSGAFSLDAVENNTVHLNMKNETGNTQGVLYWTTDSAPEFDLARSAAFPLVPHDDDYTNYTISLVDNSEWAGKITRLRVVLADDSAPAGFIRMNEISFDKVNRAPIEYTGELHDVRIDEHTITVQGSVYGHSEASLPTLALYELDPYEHERDIASLTPIAVQPTPPGGGEFSFVVPRKDGQRDRYYSKFLVTEQANGDPSSVKYVSAPRYATDIAFRAANEYAYPVARSKKGLQVLMSDDAEDLGVAHAAINVVTGALLYKENLNPSNVIEYPLNGRTYYFDKEYVESLDRQIKPLSDNDAIVNLVIILYDGSDPNRMVDVLKHPDAVAGEGGGTVLAFNTVEEEGIEAFKAVMEFLTDRYTREDEKYGRAVGYIVGNEVDAQWVWQNMGEKTVSQFIDDYESAVRIAYLAARKHYNNPRIYISLTDHWTQPYDNNPRKAYKGRDVVDLMNRTAKRQGDYPWHVAFHPYPEDFFNTDTWNDERALDSFDTPKITFKNLHVLNDYMGQSDLFTNGERRRIILSEQGFHTKDDSLAVAKEQAAAYAYAYYKTQFLSGIDSFILFSHIDIPVAGLNMGLWTQDPDTSDPFVPKSKKYIYNVFKYIDTNRSLEVTDFAKPIIGISDWGEVAPGFDPDALALREIPEVVPMAVEAAAPAAEQGDNFDAGLDGWEAADHALSVETTDESLLGDGALKVEFSERSMKWRGAQKRYADAYDATSTPYLHLGVKLTGSVAGDPYYVKVKAYSGKDWAEGVARVDPAAGWTSLSLDLSGWGKRHTIDRMKVWAASTGSRNWEGSLLIDEVSFTEAQSAAGANFDAVARLGSDTPAAGSTIELEVTNNGSALLQGNMTVTGINGVYLDLEELDVQGMSFGETRSFTATITGYAPTNGRLPGIRFQYEGRNLDQTIGVRKPTGENQLPSHEELLFNFEGVADGWVAGSNADSVQSVEKIANGPFGPALGSYALEVQFPTANADVWRTISVTSDHELDLSGADQFFYHINSYGGSGGTGYETRVRLHSGDEVLEQTFPMNPDQWNRIGLDIGNWAHRDNVTGIEIAFRSVGSSNTWYGSRFQIDYVGVELQDTVPDPINLVEDSLRPFWEGNTMLNESVLMVSRNHELPETRLLFQPTEIVSVRSARLDREYREGIDWVWEDGKLRLTEQSRIPYLTYDEMYPAQYVQDVSMPKIGGGAVIYREGSYFHDRQIVVTYKHEGNVWQGPVPQAADQRLPKTFGQLRQGKPLTMVLYGDSISVGANASSFSQAPPYLPIWGRMVADGLARGYGSEITFINPSVGGTTSAWGKDNAQELVADEKPDLVILAFGMNDGAGSGQGDGTSPEQFKANIQSMIDTIRADNPTVEFILVGTTLPNAETFFLDKQSAYYAVLEQLADSLDGVAAANMTGVHQELLKFKSFSDMTGNNINHPNDFLSRWYAQFVLGMLKTDQATPVHPPVTTPVSPPAALPEERHPDVIATIEIGGAAVPLRVVKETKEGLAHTKVILDKEQLSQALASSEDQAAIIVVNSNDPAISVDLPVNAVRTAVALRSDAYVEIRTNEASYRIPASVFMKHSKDITLTLVITQASERTSEEIRAAARRAGGRMLVAPIDFTLFANGRMIADLGGVYVTRALNLPSPGDPERLTAVWVDADSNMHFAPSYFISGEGFDKAEIYSPHNGLYTVIESDKSFPDTNGHWARHAIRLLANKLIVIGVADGNFEPDRTITRAEFTALLVRSMGLPESVAEDGSFADVAASQWYAGAVAAARQSGLVSGYPDRTFDPNGQITREQMAVMILGALKLSGKEVPRIDDKQLERFVDHTEVSGWARDEVSQLLVAQVIQGTSKTELGAREHATRAEAAMMLKRMLQYLKFMNEDR
ncbi:DUF5722 domain-containing protein [Paenibacillaceae bacterium WGS1546]|uniref:DUF5722 domain-containing protein n=1 Tax=Cohnella sp. WGS1546 TaxID=3366810 RepID=UPI00372D1A4F